jgi:hypothetical protein
MVLLVYFAPALFAGLLYVMTSDGAPNGWAFAAIVLAIVGATLALAEEEPSTDDSDHSQGED